MNESPSRVISVRAIEDIMQIQKLIEDSPNSKTIPTGKDQSDERIFLSVLKHDVYSPNPHDNRLTCISKDCDIENSFKCTGKTCKRLVENVWEEDCGFTEYVNPDVVILENFGIIENKKSEDDVKCWSSDSDITVLRVKKEYRNELSNKVEWEEQRNLEDDASSSSVSLGWESHSLINLAGVASKEKDVHETLTPFTIWSKSKNDTRNSSMIFVENLNSSTPFTPEVGLTVQSDGDHLMEKKKKGDLSLTEKSIKKRSLKNFFRLVFGCFLKRKPAPSP